MLANINYDNILNKFIKINDDIKLITINNKKDISIQKLNGLSNDVYLIEVNDNKLIFKELIIQKIDEYVNYNPIYSYFKTLEFLDSLNFCPKIYYKSIEDNCIIEEYIDNITVLFSDITLNNEIIYMNTIAIFNKIKIGINYNNSKNNYFFEYINNFLTADIPYIIKKYSLTNNENEVLNINLLSDVSNLYNNIVSKYKLNLVYSHNDFHFWNIFFNKKSKKFMLIDFEYTGNNVEMIDLFNYIFESCFDYGYDNHPYYKFYEDKLDDKEKIIKLITYYLYFKNNNTSVEDELSINNNFFQNIESSNSFKDLNNKALFYYELRYFYLMLINYFFAYWSLNKLYYNKDNINASVFDYSNFMIMRFSQFKKYYNLCKELYN